MELNRNRIHVLLEEYSRNTISEGEFEELCEIVREGHDDELKGIFEAGLREANFKEMDRRKLDRMLGEVLERGSGVRNSESGANTEMQGGHVRRMIKRVAVAASIILTIGLGSYFLFFNKSDKQPEIVKTTPQDVKAPESNRAMITLADGRVVYLDSTGSGTLATTGNVTVTKNSKGEIVYTGAATKVEYNTLINPRGSKVQPLTLSDGTKVWLNSESSLKYPTAFIGNERKVEISGEAYFEVTHDASKKFIVASNGVNTEVLGTHFNVNSYTDEGSVKVTLLEGSVKVTKDNGTGLLKPGQQASVSDKVNVTDGIDLEEVMAWKNGQFIFNGSDIKAIMREAARWYDLEVEYKGTINKNFKGKVPRTVNISELFQIMEATGWVHFKIEGKKVVVTP